MSNLKIRSFIGEELFSEESPKPIVDKILYERNAIMWLGSEKAGKSLQVMQLFRDIVNGHPFLDTFPIVRSGPVVYIQAEGDHVEFHNRLSRMARLDNMDTSKFLHIYKRSIPLDIDEFREEVFAIIAEKVKNVWGCNPVSIAFDSIYKCFSTDLIENVQVRQATSIIDSFIETFDSSAVLIHHDSKEIRSENLSSFIERGDKGSYGSVFLRAYVDHILYLKARKGMHRTFSCDTQRSGNMTFDLMNLVLLQPDPLGFFQIADHRVSIEVIKSCLFKATQPMTNEEICLVTGLHRNTVSPAINSMLDQKIVSSTDSKPRLFSLIR